MMMMKSMSFERNSLPNSTEIPPIKLKLDFQKASLVSEEERLVIPWLILNLYGQWYDVVEQIKSLATAMLAKLNALIDLFDPEMNQCR